MRFTIEIEEPGDASAIYSLNTTAFDGQTEEADLVDALRSSGELILSLVARDSDAINGCEVVGHAAFSRIVIDTADGPVDGVALAPVGVLPGFQSKGIGSRLVQRGLDVLDAANEQVVLVVGNPAYYTRFGFSVAAGKRYPNQHSGPNLMALVLSEPAAAPIGPVRYPESFNLVN